ncbi:MAG: hypothetical protein MI743_21870 [Sneathiellales bacterium]|nr:hypothetical protein [Sneathiellales bacterium]
MSTFLLLKKRFSLLALPLLLTACNEPSQSELLSKVQGVSNKADFIAALGDADHVEKDGALEHWRYNAAEGDVCFTIAGSVVMRMLC